MNLREAWSRDTSADPDNWTPENPAWGQCAVTALVIQDLLGGRLCRSEVLVNDERLSHYYNELEDGTHLDETLCQFPEDVGFYAHEEYRTREYVLSHPDTARRYETLKERLAS